ncbi:MAG TPA: type II toxin-antitoxin system VapC family toxin [Dehalococcoidia bacterium]|nr:type II toxin-antitoxin system VapC family toxin [Dehalococcoidia bacterium]
MIYVDASPVLAFLLPDEVFTRETTALFGEWRETQESMIAPALLLFKVLSGLRLAAYASRIDVDQADQTYATFRQMPIRISHVDSLTDRCWGLGKLLNPPRRYDASYLALADIEDCEVWTADRRFVRFVAGRSPRLRWVGKEVQDDGSA